MLSLGLAVCIVLAYVGALWWLLRCESTQALVGIVALGGVALSLRLVYTTDYPRGLNEDEPKILACAYRAVQRDDIFGEGCTLMPMLLSALFQGQLLPVLGPNRWAIRTYSLVTSVLSVAAVFAVARGLGVGVLPSLAAAAFVAVLPWSIFYGRISVGGELTFHELLLLAALVQVVWRRAGWAAVAIGGFGLALLLYDYFSGRAMAAMPLLAAVLARGWRARAACLAMLAVALLAWVPHLRTHPANAVGGMMVDRLHPDYFRQPLTIWWARTQEALQCFVAPRGLDGWLTVRAAAIQPPLLLGLAVLGVLTGVRRGLFLLGGFVIGLAPAVLSDSNFPSVHRMQMAFPFVALAAACALDLLRWRVLCAVATAAVVLIVAMESVRLYFSDTFWFENSRAVFEWERTAVAEALPSPPHPHFIIMKQLGYYFDPRAEVDPDYEMLTVENWLPPQRRAVIYAFTELAGALRSFYSSLLGPARVQSFGRAFLVRYEAADWSWLRQHGWAYEEGCGTEVRRALVPTLYHVDLHATLPRCEAGVTQVWHGRWLGPRTALRLKFTGAVTVDTPNGRLVDDHGVERTDQLTLEPNTEVTVTLTSAPRERYMWAALVEVTPAGERVPAWERVSPIVGAAAAAGDTR